MSLTLLKNPYITTPDENAQVSTSHSSATAETGMKSPNVDPFRCPLCGSSNECGVASGEKQCWCFSQPVPQGVLQKLPIEALGVACVCRACAMSQSALERALGQMAEVLRRR